MKVRTLLLLLLIITCSFSLGVIAGTAKSESIHVQVEEDCSTLSTSCDSLIKTEKDLIRKVDILNRYLTMKHIEYIESCKLLTANQE